MYKKNQWPKNHNISNLMTDDCTAERNALNRNWPRSKQLQCQFHVLQAFLKWLQTKQNLKNSRQELINLLKKVVYQKNREKIITDIAEFRKMADLNCIDDHAEKLLRKSKNFHVRIENLKFFIMSIQIILLKIISFSSKSTCLRDENLQTLFM